MVTKKDVAEYAGVSTATVSRVINGVGYISNKTERKVKEAIKELNYIPNRLARNLACNKSNIIAVLVEDLNNPYNMTIVDAMVERANEFGFVVSIFAIKNRDVKGVLDDLASNMVCGIINLAMFTCDFSLYDIFLESGTKLVNCTQDSSIVSIDYTTGMEETMTYLKANGFKDIAFISGLEEWLTYKDSRVKYFMENRNRFGFTENNKMIFSADYPITTAYQVGFSLANQLMQTKLHFDSVICLTDMMALGAIKAFIDKGYKIPDDVSIVGGDGLEITEYMQPPLTTINVDKRAEGFAYIDYVLGKITKIKQIETHLIVRNSVKELK